jgi:predicted DNA-binding protein
MSETVKFSSKMRPEMLEAMRAHAAEAGRTVASVLDEAVEQYLARERVRPAFRDAAEQVMSEHAELLERLAR